MLGFCFTLGSKLHCLHQPNAVPKSICGMRAIFRLSAEICYVVCEGPYSQKTDLARICPRVCGGILSAMQQVDFMESQMSQQLEEQACFAEERVSQQESRSWFFLLSRIHAFFWNTRILVTVQGQHGDPYPSPALSA